MISNYLKHVINILYRDKLYITLKFIALKVSYGNYCLCKSKACCLFNSLGDICHSSALTRETKLTYCDKVIWNYRVCKRGYERKGYSKVCRRLIKVKPAYDIKINVIGRKLKSKPFLKYCKNKIRTGIVYTV